MYQVRFSDSIERVAALYNQAMKLHKTSCAAVIQVEYFDKKNL